MEYVVSKDSNIELFNIVNLQRNLYLDGNEQHVLAHNDTSSNSSCINYFCYSDTQDLDVCSYYNGIKAKECL